MKTSRSLMRKFQIWYIFRFYPEASILKVSVPKIVVKGFLYGRYGPCERNKGDGSEQWINFPNFAQLHGKILRNRTYVRKKHISR